MFQTTYAITHPQKAFGFTLIELSIVLVIMGLIVGGVLVGQDLIKAAELRKIVTTAEQIKTAHYTFKLKYDAIAGDIINAKTFWPDDSQYSGFVTWNGDGDRIIEFGNYEYMRVFQHMSLAGLIPGEYIGGNSAITLEAGVHILAGPFQGGYISWMGTNQPDSLKISFGTSTLATLSRHDDKVLIPIDAKSIDDKTDDGLATQGHFWAFDPHGGGPPDCTTVPSGDIYDVDQPEIACRVGFAY